MNKGALITAVSEAFSVKPSEAKTTVETMMEIIAKTLKAGEEVTLPGIGKLKVALRPGRVGRNPSTGAEIAIPAKRVVKFTPASEFNETFKTVV